MIEYQPNLVIVDGPQGSGKTSAIHHLSNKHRFNSLRGIPTGEDLVKNKEYLNWQESSNILLMASKSPDRTALDRSIISLVAFNMRTKPSHSDLIYRLGDLELNRLIKPANNYLVIILESIAGECYERNCKNSQHSVKSIQESQSEIEIYTELYKRLKGDGLRVITLQNKGISMDEFIKKLEAELCLN